MGYHSIHRTNESFEFTVMWVLIGAFLLAMPFLFIHPGVVIILLWSGLVTLAVAVPIHALITRAEHGAAEKALRRHACPECGARIEQVPSEDGDWHCRECDSVFPADALAAGE